MGLDREEPLLESFCTGENARVERLEFVGGESTIALCGEQLFPLFRVCPDDFVIVEIRVHEFLVDLQDSVETYGFGVH